MKRTALALGASILAACTTAPPRADAQPAFSANGKTLRQIYEYLHINPELSFQEKNSSAILAAEMKRLGFTVTTGAGMPGPRPAPRVRQGSGWCRRLWRRRRAARTAPGRQS